MSYTDKILVWTPPCMGFFQSMYVQDSQVLSRQRSARILYQLDKIFGFAAEAGEPSTFTTHSQAPTALPGILEDNQVELWKLPEIELSPASDWSQRPPQTSAPLHWTPSASMLPVDGSQILNSAAEVDYLEDKRGDNVTRSLQALTNQPAFSGLVREVTHIMSQYAEQKMGEVQRCVYLCPTAPGLHLRYRALFNIDWDLKEFLKQNYENESDRDISKVAVVIGTENTAILCSVGEYLAINWPSLPAFLPEAIMSCLRHPERKYYGVWGKFEHHW